MHLFGRRRKTQRSNSAEIQMAVISKRCTQNESAKAEVQQLQRKAEKLVNILSRYPCFQDILQSLDHPSSIVSEALKGSCSLSQGSLSQLGIPFVKIFCTKFSEQTENHNSKDQKQAFDEVNTLIQTLFIEQSELHYKLSSSDRLEKCMQYIKGAYAAYKDQKLGEVSGSKNPHPPSPTCRPS